MLTYLLFIVGFVLLIKGADWLVDGSASIARKMRVSSIVIGLTVVSFGTSSPELVVNLIASINGNTEIAIGNILGSNIANILLILGISAAIFPLVAQRNTVFKEIPLSLLAAILLGTMANDTLLDGVSYSGLTRSDGIVLIAFFIIFLYYSFGIAQITGDESLSDDLKEYTTTKSIVLILLGLAGLVIGGKWIVDGAVKIAQYFDMSESLIGLTVVAVGTSLPELATSAVAAYKKESDIAIGNVVGSNIFNIFFVLGVSSLIHPIPFQRSSDVDIIMTILSSVILFVLLFIGRRHTIDRWQGGLMVLFYISYIIYLIQKG